MQLAAPVGVDVLVLEHVFGGSCGLDIGILDEGLETFGFVEDHNLFHHSVWSEHLVQDIYCDGVHSIVNCHEEDAVWWSTKCGLLCMRLILFVRAPLNTYVSWWRALNNNTRMRVKLLVA